MKLLIVEDDSEIRKLLSDFLTEHGYEVVTASEGRAAARLMREQTFSLILMDLMLPYRGGDDLIKELREYSNTPVIVLSAKSRTETRLEVLRVGADDYIIKPFDLNEVLVRIEVVLRRAGGYGGMSGNAINGAGRAEGGKSIEAGRSVGTGIDRGIDRNGGVVRNDEISGSGMADQIYAASDGKLVFFLQENRAAYEDKNLTLTAKELALLHLFLQYPTKTFTKANLYEAVWNDTYYYEDNTINVHMSNLRSKLKKQTGNDYIETVWGIGYRLKNMVSEGSKDDAQV